MKFNKDKEKINELLKILENTIKNIKPKNLAIAFSGGVDSSLLAGLLKKADYKIKVYVAGMKNSHDIAKAEKAARKIGITLKKIVLTKKDIEESLPIQARILKKVYEGNNLKSYAPKLKPTNLSISFNLPLFFVCKYAKEKFVVIGQGPDEMLGGYHRYKKLKKKEAEKAMNKDTKNLININYLQNKATAQYFKKELIMPYLKRDFVNFCMSLPYELKINKADKYILRKVAEKILGKKIAFRKKKAAQYGSGIMNEMIKIAKRG